MPRPPTKHGLDRKFKSWRKGKSKASKGGKGGTSGSLRNQLRSQQRLLSKLIQQHDNTNNNTNTTNNNSNEPNDDKNNNNNNEEVIFQESKLKIEEKIQNLELAIQHRNAIEREKKLATKYHQIKFFERQKLTRQERKVQTKLQEAKAAIDYEDITKYQNLLVDICINQLYVAYFPNDKKYISIFAPNCTTTITDSSNSNTRQHEEDAKNIKLRNSIRMDILDKVKNGEIDCKKSWVNITILREMGVIPPLRKKRSREDNNDNDNNYAHEQDDDKDDDDSVDSVPITKKSKQSSTKNNNSKESDSDSSSDVPSSSDSSDDSEGDKIMKHGESDNKHKNETIHDIRKVVDHDKNTNDAKMSGPKNKCQDKSFTNTLQNQSETKSSKVENPKRAMSSDKDEVISSTTGDCNEYSHPDDLSSASSSSSSSSSSTSTSSSESDSDDDDGNPLLNDYATSTGSNNNTTKKEGSKKLSTITITDSNTNLQTNIESNSESDDDFLLDANNQDDTNDNSEDVFQKISQRGENNFKNKNAKNGDYGLRRGDKSKGWHTQKQRPGEWKRNERRKKNI